LRLARVWAKDDPFGTEYAEIALSRESLEATGLAIGSEPLPYRLEYELTTTERYLTKKLIVSSRGPTWHRRLVLERNPTSGTWSCTADADGDVDLPAPGCDAAKLNGALDCDLSLSPLTNSMPVLRHALHTEHGSIDFLMAWVAVPELTVTPSPQRYTFVRPGVVRYESLDSDFVAEITLDAQGIVLDYPGIARTIR
jgi:uncharacterized protein